MTFQICDRCLKVCEDSICTECDQGEIVNEICQGVCLDCWPKYVSDRLDDIL